MTRRSFTRTGGRELFAGHVISLHVDTFRFDDGEEIEREIVRHPGAVGIVAHDGTDLYLVRQPRPAVGDPDVLEIPAGLLDKAGEPPIETAARELKEEIGKAPGRIEHLHSFWTSVGSFDEEVHLFLATDLRDEAEDSGENERIEVIRSPLSRLGETIAACRDSKTLIGLLLLQVRLSG